LIVTGIKIPLVKSSTKLTEVIISAMNKGGTEMKERDILAVASKIISISEQRVVDLTEVKPRIEAKKLSRKYRLKPEFVEIVLTESDEVLGGVYKAILTIKDGMLVANAGADISNAQPNHAILWPKNPQKTARELKSILEAHYAAHIGVVLVDSRTTPLRLGTTGLAIAAAGINSIRDYRGKLDLYGKPLHVTRQNLADDLASTAHLIMGEAKERIPLVLIRDHGVPIINNQKKDRMKIPWKQCLYMRVLRDCVKKINHTLGER
jgi:coenzyme F420-0:L-glutamate ligase